MGIGAWGKSGGYGVYTLDRKGGYQGDCCIGATEVAHLILYDMRLLERWRLQKG